MVEAPMIFVAYSKACCRNSNDVWGEGAQKGSFHSTERPPWRMSSQHAVQVSTACGEGCCKISPHLGCDAEDRCNSGNSASS